MDEQIDHYERQILSSTDEVRMGTLQVARLAKRSITILTPDLELGLYDDLEFLEIVKHLVLSSSYASVRVLISDPANTVRNGNKFVELGRKLHSYIEFRNLHECHRGKMNDTYIIADNVAVLYRKDARRPDGIMGCNEIAIAEQHLKTFSQPWEDSVFMHAMPVN